MNQPLVSVCIPVYNAENYIGETLRSVIDQSFKNIEIIIVDDGSTDQSLHVASQHQSKQIKIFSQANKGASAARNRCLTEAKGDIIQFLDADDLLSPDKIAEQVSILIKNPGMIAVCSTVHFNDGESPLEFKPSAYEEAFLITAEPAHFLLNLYGGFGENGSMVQPNAWLTPRDIIDKAGLWNEELTLDDDGEFFCRVVLNSGGVIKSKGLNYYRKYSNVKYNLSALKEKQHLESQYKALKLKIKNLHLYTLSPNLSKIHAVWLHDLKFKAYPSYPGLIKLLDKDIADLNCKYKPKNPFATRIGRLLSGLLGWKAAKRLQFFKQVLKH